MNPRSALVTAAFFAAVGSACVYQPSTRPLTFDNQIYFYAAVRAADGVPPHVSLVDHKHQLPVLLDGLAMAVGRVFGIDDVVSSRVTSITTVGVLAMGVTWVGCELAGEVSGALALLTLLAFPDIFTQAAMGSRPQLLMAALAIMSILAFGKRRFFTAGLAAAGSFLCWQPAALIGAGLAAATLTLRERLAAVGRLVAGALSAVIAYEAYFAWKGALGEQLFQSYVLPSHLDSYPYPDMKEAIAFFLEFGLPWRVDSSRFISASLLVLLAGAPIWALARRKSVLSTCRSRPAWPATLVCAYLTTALTFRTHQGYPDMFFPEPFIAVFSGVVLAGIGAAFARLHPRLVRLRIVTAIAAAVWLLGLGISRREAFSSRGLQLADQRALSNQLDVLDDDYGSIWAIGCPHLLGFLRRENFLPYGLLIDPKVQAYMTRAHPGEAYLPLRDGKLPGAVLSSRGGLRTGMPWFPRVYRRVHSRSFERQGIQIWVRKPLHAGETPNTGTARAPQ
jgi:hypothetical protein